MNIFIFVARPVYQIVVCKTSPVFHDFLPFDHENSLSRVETYMNTKIHFLRKSSYSIETSSPYRPGIVIFFRREDTLCFPFPLFFSREETTANTRIDFKHCQHFIGCSRVEHKESEICTVLYDVVGFQKKKKTFSDPVTIVILPNINCFRGVSFASQLIRTKNCQYLELL